MNSPQRSVGEPQVTAQECAAAGVPPAEFTAKGGDFKVVARLQDGAYLVAAGPPGSGASFEAWPCAALDADGIAEALFARIPQGHVERGIEGEVVVAGDTRLALSARSGVGESRAEHAGVIVVDPMHAPRGVLFIFSVAAPDESAWIPTPAAVLGRAVFEALLGALRVGAAKRESVRASGAAVAPPTPAEVEYVDGTERVRRRLGVRETFGRARDNSVVLTDTMTSKHHAVIEWDGARFVLYDRGSINGTRVEGALVRGAVPLTHNAKVVLGRVSMRFRELVQAQSTQLHDLCRRFELEGLAVPHVPPALGMRLEALGPWFFSTVALAAPPLHGDLGVPVAGDYLVVCHSVGPHGVATIQYCLGLGPLRIALEWPWTLGAGGAPSASARQLIAASVLGLRALVGATLQCVRHDRWPHGVVLEVRAIHGVRSSWSPVGGGLARRTTGALGMPAPDVLADALAWVHGL